MTWNNSYYACVVVGALCVPALSVKYNQWRKANTKVRRQAIDVERGEARQNDARDGLLAPQRSASGRRALVTARSSEESSNNPISDDNSASSVSDAVEAARHDRPRIDMAQIEEALADIRPPPPVYAPNDPIERSPPMYRPSERLPPAYASGENVNNDPPVESPAHDPAGRIAVYQETLQRVHQLRRERTLLRAAQARRSRSELFGEGNLPASADNLNASSADAARSPAATEADRAFASDIEGYEAVFANWY